MTGHIEKIEDITVFSPVFGDNGLIPCITTGSKTGTVLMMAWMNEESLALTLKTGDVHYWSRSRQELWHKGATSGHTQKVVEIRTDCDQDCLWIIVEEPDESCHTGRKTCFYRKVTSPATLAFIDIEDTE